MCRGVCNSTDDLSCSLLSIVTRYLMVISVAKFRISNVCPWSLKFPQILGVDFVQLEASVSAALTGMLSLVVC